MAEPGRQTDNVRALKVPPHSVEAEQAVLGGLLLVNRAWDDIADRINADDFYRREHRQLFEAIAELREHDHPCDAVTLSEWLQDRDALEEAGGAAYIVDLASNTPSAANIKRYADIVREKSVMRSLIDVSHEITESAFHPEGRSAGDLLELAEKSVFDIRDRSMRSGGEFISARDGVKQAFERIEELYEKGSEITGVASGFTDFDKRTAGLQPGDLIIVAGRPSMGKTSFAMNLAEYAAIKLALSVAVFSMEMAAIQLVMRMISSLGRINQQRIRTGSFQNEDWSRLQMAINLLAETNLFIDETPAMSPIELRARARRLKRKHGLDLIVVDYLQLMQVPGNRENRATEISEISRALKALAKELQVPVVALSQLNRSLEQRPNKRPVMADLRESGAIEQDADLIVFIYRDEVYNEDSPDRGKAEIIIGKQRNGETGTIALTFRGEYTRFDNYISSIGDMH